MNNNESFLDVFNSTTSSASSNRSPASTIRPRNRRLVSTIGDDESEDGGVGPSGSQHKLFRSSSGDSGNLTPPQSRAATPLYSSRGASPIPSKHPSRYTEAPTSHPTRGQSDIFSSGLSVGGNRSTPEGGNPAAFAADLWESSWTSLQGLASSVLGSNTTQGKQRSGTRGHQRRKPSTATNIFGGPIKSTAPSTWGPSSSTIASRQIGVGTKEERHALVQAKKREALLQANGERVADTMGRFKRRDSGAKPQSPTSMTFDEDALVYVHNVQPNDSITGVTIKYGCQPAIFRKANAFWPSDSIQVRKTVLVPVEACSTKGRRVPTPPPEKQRDLLGDDEVDSLEDLHSSSIAPPPEGSSGAAKDAESFGKGTTEMQNNNERLETSSRAGTEHHNDPPWKHESWVQVDGFPELVEIGRVPRRNLGFFPRTRRKSQSLTPYSDFETPPTSSDISRVPSQSYNGPQSPPQLPTFSTPQSGFPDSWTLPRTRSSSIANLPPQGPSLNGHRKRNSFYLSGPGGVGTLSQDAVGPGPGADRLNKFFGSANPAPQPQTQSHLAPPRRNSLESTTSTVVSNASSTTGLENVGGAIEGWVRKVASRAKTGLNELQQQQQSGGGSSGSGGFGSFRIPGIGAMGDLIELDDGMEGRNSNAHPHTQAGAHGGSMRDTRNSSLQPHDEAFLRGRRFPSPSPGGSRRERSTLASEERFKDD
ncbi:hypothetical protein FQN54_002306 [Arachnomyces sp. PD_36]|nr:hypothetical protein FQN54_002306 [Arachnomyces sp. PD_36]